MTHRTVICVLLVAVVGVALACGRVTEGDPIPQAQEVRAPEVETPDETAESPEQDAAASPVTPATAEPAKVEEPEPSTVRRTRTGHNDIPAARYAHFLSAV